MASDIKAKALVFDGSCEATNVSRVSFKNFRWIAAPRQLVSGSQTGWPSADNDDSMRVAIRQIAFSAQDSATPVSN